MLLNHAPTVGFGVGLGLLILALFNKQHDDLKRMSLVVLFVVAVLTIPTYLSGGAAEFVLRGGKDGPPRFPREVSIPAIRSHEDAALLGLVFMEITGFFAWLALWQWRKTGRLVPWNLTTVVLLSFLTFGLMARAASIGGEIRHSEFRPALAETAAPQSDAVAAQTDPAAEPEPDWPGPGAARSLALWITEENWVWPACETLHFVGLCLLFTVVLLVDLRTLGVAKIIPIASVYQLLPVGMLGFGINLITGMMFFIGAPAQYVENIAYFWKFVLLVGAAGNDLYFMMSDQTWGIGRGADAPLVAKVAAGSGLFLWLGVLFCGHMLPFLGNAF